MVNLSLAYGNSDGSCYAYVWLATYAGPRFGDYRAGFRFGQLGYDLVEKRGLTRYKARTYSAFGNIVVPWKRHILDGRELIRRSFEFANESGDLTYAAYGCCDLIQNLLAVGDPLVEVQREIENGLEFAHKARFGLVVDIMIAQFGLVQTLRGLTPTFGSFNTAAFDELRFEQHLSRDPALALPEFLYWTRKLQARYFAGDYAAAQDAALSAQRLLWIAPSQFEVAEFRFYAALSHGANWDGASPARKQQHVEALAAHHAQLQVWAQHCPENFDNRAALVGAEIARIEDRAFDAMRLYEQAIRSARENSFRHNEALAYELAARFYAARGFDQIAHLYLRNARNGYLHWGAEAKVRQLDESCLKLREEEPEHGTTGTIGTFDAPVEQLDLATVIKVSEAVAGEFVLENLVDTVLRAAIEHAGAERGLLIMQRESELRAEAEAIVSADTVIVRQGVGAALPKSVVHYVARVRESVMLDDASAQNPFSDDPYIRHYRARSILCLPLINQTKLIGVLYLENNLASHVFTTTRSAVLKVLASQAASRSKTPVCIWIWRNARRRSGASWTRASSACSSGMSPGGSTRLTTRFCGSSDTVARISPADG